MTRYLLYAIMCVRQDRRAAGGVSDEDGFWALAGWEPTSDTVLCPGVHPRWQEVLDRRQAERVDAAVERELAADRQNVRWAIGRVVMVGGWRGRIEGTCRAGVLVRRVAGYRECVPWAEVLQVLCDPMGIFA